MEHSQYLHLPKELIIRIKNGLNEKPIEIKDIIVGLHLFAFAKNDYYLGPFFTDENGVAAIPKDWIEISARATSETGLMDYRPFQECASLVEVSILSEEEKSKLLEARNYWGISESESKLYETKEDLIKLIEKSNNHLVQPIKKRLVLDNTVSSTAEVVLYTSLKKDEIAEQFRAQFRNNSGRNSGASPHNT